MRHRVYGKHLGRNKNQRQALFKGLVRSLILHESITTTESKAKAIKGLIDNIVVKGKEGSVPAKRFIQGFLPDVVVSKKLLEEIAPRFLKRTSGFTSLVKLGRRLGDGAMMVKMGWMEGGKSSVISHQSSEKGKPVVSSSVEESVTEKQKTGKPGSENRKRKTDNKKIRKGSK